MAVKQAQSSSSYFQLLAELAVKVGDALLSPFLIQDASWIENLAIFARAF